MTSPEQISQYMSLREPQREALRVLHEISATIDYKTALLDATCELQMKPDIIWATALLVILLMTAPAQQNQKFS